MNKLTAEKCREMFLHLFGEKRQDGITLKEDLYMQALEIALPVLEQQEGQESVIAEHLKAVRDCLALTPHQDAIISCAIDRINLLTARTLELSRSLIKQQEKANDGWIEWGGGECPVPENSRVDIKFRDGDVGLEQSANWDWIHLGYRSDIIAYRIILEQPINQSGEQ